MYMYKSILFMRFFWLVSVLLYGLALPYSQANDLPTPKRSAGGTPPPVTLSVTVSPVSATYTVGQSVTVTITGGISGTAYAVSLLDEQDFPIAALTYLSDQGTNNTFTWPAGASSYSMVVTFLESALSLTTLDRVLDVTNLSNNSYADSDIFTVLPKPTLSLTLSPALGTYAVGNSVTATLTGGIVGEKYVVMLYGDAAYTTNLSQNITPTNSQSGVNTIPGRRIQRAGNSTSSLTPVAKEVGEYWK